MGYRLSLADDVATAVRAVARTQLAGAADAVERAARDGPDRAAAVHEARRRLKKARALLRLVRGPLGDAYAREDGALRAVAAALADARDADAQRAAVAGLAARYAGRLPTADFAAAATAVGADRPAAALDGAALTAALRDAAGRVDRWPLEGAAWADVRAGAARAYARGRRALDAVRADPDDVAAWHAWRKRVKDLWYHHRLLRDALPPVMAGYAAALHELSELLGDDHDLALLRARLTRGSAPPAGAGDDAALLALVDARRAGLRGAALRLGGRLYGERPKAFRRRIGSWLPGADGG